MSASQTSSGDQLTQVAKTHDIQFSNGGQIKISEELGVYIAAHAAQNMMSKKGVGVEINSSCSRLVEDQQTGVLADKMNRSFDNLE